MQVFTRALLIIALVGVAGSSNSLRIPRERVVKLRLHLRSRLSESEIEAAFVAHTTPDSPLFRRHVFGKQLADIMGASPKRIERVRGALSDVGAKNIMVFSTGDIIEADVPLYAGLPKLLCSRDASRVASFRNYVDELQRLSLDACIAPDLREDVASLVAGVSFASEKLPHRHRQRVSIPLNPGMEQTPTSILARYKVPSTPQTPMPKSVLQAVAEIQNQGFAKSDIQTFFSKFGTQQGNVKVIGLNANHTSVEGTMDIEYISAVGNGVPTAWVGQTGGSLTSIAEAVLTMKPIPSVLSVSFNWPVSQMGKRAAVVMQGDNAAFRKLALAGVSVIVASGDDGPDGSLSQCTSFEPGWPASSPYVTTVGATYSMSQSGSEHAASYSGGGFSNHFETPAWQADAVRDYLASNATKPVEGLFNPKGRAFPDVSALGSKYMFFGPVPIGPGREVAGDSFWNPVTGTSCATPTFAGIIARINANRVAAGKPLLGFLNPSLYKLGRVGVDVTEGSSYLVGCPRPRVRPGFAAVAGWDASTGLGTPDFEFLNSNL